MSAFDKMWIWPENSEGKRLYWYREVAENRMPAKFRIARTIPVNVELGADNEEALWAELERQTEKFVEIRETIRTGNKELDPPVKRSNLLDLCHELSRRMLGHCNFCAWNCNVDRVQGNKLGTCKLASETRVSTFFHHQGEELIYRGTLGSGTIFFTSCNMRCAFCQNGDISTDKDNGIKVTPRVLATMVWLLRMEGCHNINWVGGDPIIHLHTIVAAISILADDYVHPTEEDLRQVMPVKADYLTRPVLDESAAHFEGAFNAPILWNSNFYASIDAMKILRLLVDVWLPDFKFGPGRCAIKLARTPRYWEVVTSNLDLIETWKEDVTIRHLVMPNHIECCTYPVIDWIADHMPDTEVNVMNQYHPDMFTNPYSSQYQSKFEVVSRQPNEDEILSAYLYAQRKGVAFERITFETPPTSS